MNKNFQQLFCTSWDIFQKIYLDKSIKNVKMRKCICIKMRHQTDLKRCRVIVPIVLFMHRLKDTKIQTANSLFCHLGTQKRAGKLSSSCRKDNLLFCISMKYLCKYLPNLIFVHNYWTIVYAFIISCDIYRKSNLFKKV